jgi:hypothetical protein
MEGPGKGKGNVAMASLAVLLQVYVQYDSRCMCCKDEPH